MSRIVLNDDLGDDGDYFSVPTVRLETVFREHSVLGYERILIKVDVEGYERPVMSTLMRLIESHRNARIICEILPNSASKSLLRDEAKHYGLDVLQIDSSNYLFARKSS